MKEEIKKVDIIDVCRRLGVQPPQMAMVSRHGMGYYVTRMDEDFDLGPDFLARFVRATGRLGVMPPLNEKNLYAAFANVTDDTQRPLLDVNNSGFIRGNSYPVSMEPSDMTHTLILQLTPYVTDQELRECYAIILGNMLVKAGLVVRKSSVGSFPVPAEELSPIPPFIDDPANPSLAYVGIMSVVVGKAIDDLLDAAATKGVAAPGKVKPDIRLASLTRDFATMWGLFLDGINKSRKRLADQSAAWLKTIRYIVLGPRSWNPAIAISSISECFTYTNAFLGSWTSKDSPIVEPTLDEQLRAQEFMTKFYPMLKDATTKRTYCPYEAKSVREHLFPLVEQTDVAMHGVDSDRTFRFTAWAIPDDMSLTAAELQNYSGWVPGTASGPVTFYDRPEVTSALTDLLRGLSSVRKYIEKKWSYTTHSISEAGLDYRHALTLKLYPDEAAEAILWSIAFACSKTIVVCAGRLGAQIVYTSDNRIAPAAQAEDWPSAFVDPAEAVAHANIPTQIHTGHSAYARPCLLDILKSGDVLSMPQFAPTKSLSPKVEKKKVTVDDKEFEITAIDYNTVPSAKATLCTLDGRAVDDDFALASVLKMAVNNSVGVHFEIPLSTSAALQQCAARIQEVASIKSDDKQVTAMGRWLQVDVFLMLVKIAVDCMSDRVRNVIRAESGLGRTMKTNDSDYDNVLCPNLALRISCLDKWIATLKALGIPSATQIEAFIQQCQKNFNITELTKPLTTGYTHEI